MENYNRISVLTLKIIAREREFYEDTLHLEKLS